MLLSRRSNQFSIFIGNFYDSTPSNRFPSIRYIFQTMCSNFFQANPHWWILIVVRLNSFQLTQLRPLKCFIKVKKKKKAKSFRIFMASGSGVGRRNISNMNSEQLNFFCAHNTLCISVLDRKTHSRKSWLKCIIAWHYKVNSKHVASTIHLAIGMRFGS